MTFTRKILGKKGCISNVTPTGDLVTWEYKIFKCTWQWWTDGTYPTL